MRPTGTSWSSVAPLAGSVDRNTKEAYLIHYDNKVAPLAGSVDRNTDLPNLAPVPQLSLPSRGAWIEIPRPRRRLRRSSVAPLAGSVDRNAALAGKAELAIVAPLAGSVDRNIDPLDVVRAGGPSLPSRGAWIEIQ